MRKKLLAVVLSVSLLSALFAGCGNSDADNTTEQEAGSQPAVQKENEFFENNLERTLKRNPILTICRR